MRTSSRSYAASGLTRGERIVSTYNAGPFVAGAALGAFDRLGLCHIPVGTGNTEQLMAAVELLKPTVVAMTPSYACISRNGRAQRGVDLASSSVKRVMVAGEPGGGEPAMRAKLEAAWGASVTEAMGIGDISVSLWGECEEKARHAFQRPRLRAFRADRSRERRERAADRRRDRRTRAYPSRQPLRAAACAFARATTCGSAWAPAPAGAPAPRVRCIGRTDDMLIVRGVNVFPSAVREVVNEFAPAVTGVILIRPRATRRKTGAAAAGDRRDRARRRRGRAGRAHPDADCATSSS